MYNFLMGLLISIFVSLIGGGGASLYLGVLSSQLTTDTAVATSLFVALPALFFGTLAQLHVHNVRVNVGNQLIVAALPSIVMGTIIGKFIPETVYRVLIGVLLTVMGLIVLRKNLRHHGQSAGMPHQKTQKPLMAYLLGILSGLMVGLGGLSGGATTVAGLSMMGLSTFEAAGTTTYVLCAMAFVGFITHLLTSAVAWSAGVTLMIGAIIGSVITPIVLNHLDLRKLDRPLGIFLGCVIVYFGVKMLVVV